MSWHLVLLNPSEWYSIIKAKSNWFLIVRCDVVKLRLIDKTVFTLPFSNEKK